MNQEQLQSFKEDLKVFASELNKVIPSEIAYFEARGQDIKENKIKSIPADMGTNFYYWHKADRVILFSVNILYNNKNELRIWDHMSVGVALKDQAIPTDAIEYFRKMAEDSIKIHEERKARLSYLRS